VAARATVPPTPATVGDPPFVCRPWRRR
jgi:hypothetical protein